MNALAGAVLLVVTVASVRFTAYRFPASFTPFRFEGGRAWGVVLDKLDIPSVGSLELP